MGVKIKLQSCFALPDTDAEVMVLPAGVTTLLDLLKYIGRQIDFRFMDPESGKLEMDLELILNEKAIWFYPGGLDTVLQTDDIVEIYLLPLGGG
ncbi:MAG: hypothetical protein Q8P24_21480 [Desulfobacterales bacterium]|nr:hypothetical protein [Desulfobacterales bacterium]